MASSDEQEPGAEQRLREIETELLDTCYRSYPDQIEMLSPGYVEQTPGLEQLGPLYRYGPPVLRAALINLAEAGFIETRATMGRTYARIRPEGIRELGNRRPLGTYVDMQNLNLILMDLVARVAAHVETNEGHQRDLTVNLKEVEDKVVALERDIYSRVFPFFAVFVAAFGLIITTTQGVVRINATDPGQIALQTLAMMGPVTGLVLLLVLVTWVISRWR